MDLGLRDKVALVAAASKGLGKASALALAQEGCAVAIAARGAEALAATAEDIHHQTGARVLPVAADVSRAEACEALVARVHAELGPVEILVNNAGGPRAGVFTDMSDDDWLAAFELNLLSAIRLTRLVLPEMRVRGWGRIINLTSLAVRQPIPNLILSNAVRSGVVAMAKTLAGQVAKDGVTVNNICPGYMLTDRVRHLTADRAAREGRSEEDVMAESLATIPMGRMGDPSELAALVAFLASRQASYITGATIQVDGGVIQGLL